MLRQVSSDEESFPQDRLIFELDDFAQGLFCQIPDLEYGLELVRFLSTTSSTLRTCDDIAYHLNGSPVCIERDSRVLARLGLVQTIEVDNVVLFHFSSNSSLSRVIQDVCAWQDCWDAHLRQITSTVFGKHTIIYRALPPTILFVIQASANSSARVCAQSFSTLLTLV